MLLTMRAHSACPLPIPECRSAVVTTLPAPPSALALVYSNIANCQPMAVTTVLGNLDAGNLAAAVSARERNNERVISRNRAPATICNVSIAMRPGATSVNPWAGSCRGDGADRLLIACQAADSVSRGSIARTAFRVSADRSAFRRS